MPESMSEINPNEEESTDQASNGLQDEGEMAPRKAPGSGARLWDRVRCSLLRPKVKIWMRAVDTILWEIVAKDIHYRTNLFSLPQRIIQMRFDGLVGDRTSVMLDRHDATQKRHNAVILLLDHSKSK